MAPNIQVGGEFDLVVTNLYGATTSKVATVTVNGLTIGPESALVVDSKPQGFARYGASSEAAWLPSSQDSAHNTRLGVMQFTAANGSQIVLPTAGTTNFDSPGGTIMFWMRSAGTVSHSYLEGATLFDRFTGSYFNGSGIVLAQAESGTTAGGFIRLYSSAAPEIPINSHRSVSDNKWHHVALVYDQATNGAATLYIDATLDITTQNLAAWPSSWPIGQEIELGRPHDTQWGAYDGLLDDFRIYGRTLTQPEIASVMNSDALVDTNALLVRWNFDTPPIPGIGASWPANNAVLQSAATPGGPYADLPSAATPLYVPNEPGQQFYRFRRASPIVINSNPYDM
jgi:hypothetical protein